MSAAVEEKELVLCASCGVAGGYDIKLKKCTACYLVRYCSVKCQKEHRPKHKKECKKRAAELRDELLFKEPESSCFGDCPICFLPQSIDPEKLVLMACCGKHICNGCSYANQMREIEGRLLPKCPFCRKTMPVTKEDWNGRLLNRVEANDPVAICRMGAIRCEEGDYEAAVDYWTKAAALGYVLAHNDLAILYDSGQGVEKDEKKILYHTEQAAIGGHPGARHNLGCVEDDNGRMDRAVKHWIIAANLGYANSLDALKELYKEGHVSKEDYATALSGYQSAIEAIKSPQREAATQFYNL